MYRDIEKGYNLGYIWVGREKESGEIKARSPVNQSTRHETEEFVRHLWDMR